MKIENIFITSTVGQVRNAITIIKENSLHKALVVFLFTKRNQGVLDKMIQTLEPHELGFEIIELPSNPNSGFPDTVKMIGTIYREFIKRTQPTTLWVSNLNTHYSMLAMIASKEGACINYFEEGLGSYKSIEQNAVFAFISDSSAPNTQQLVRAVLRKFARSSHLGRFVYWLKKIPAAVGKELRAYSSVASFASSQFSFYKVVKGKGDAFLKSYFAQDEQSYFKVWQSINEAHVVFPDRLDPEIFSGSEIKKLGWRFTPEATTELNDCLLEFIDFENNDGTIYISQNYGGNSAAFYSSVANCLSKRVVGSVLVKFHPKESLLQRRLLIGALRSEGLRPIADDCLQQFSAETYFETRHFQKVIGICSTALIYGEEFFPALNFHSIGTDLVERLQDEDSMPDSVKEKVSEDVHLFDEFKSKSWE